MAQDPKTELLVEIHDLIDDTFDLPEFRDLCARLGIKYDNLRGETLSDRIHDLVQMMDRREQLGDLLKLCAELRPNIDWPELPTPNGSGASSEQKSHQNQSDARRIPIGGWIGGAVVGILVLFLLFQLVGGGNDDLPVTPTNTLSTNSQITSGISTTAVMPEPTHAPADILTSTPTNTSTIIPTPLPGIGSTRIRAKDEAVMVYVPAGEFAMGSDSGDDDEQPIHGVHLDSYWTDQTEVTNGMYILCERAGVCKQPSALRSRTRSSYYPNPAYADYPVIYVSWDDAKTYCEWAGGRLPTEAEWEKVARWDEENQEARIYPWGEDIDCNFANYDDCVGDTSAVGSYPDGASPYGALDMAGNVWEWVNDVYASNYYEQRVYDNPTGPMDGSEMVRRGGSWSRSDGSIVRAADRSSNIPSYPNDLLGFRCVQD